jgi:hydroxymethylpyrimidine/phosphomethylpyrimidine kinase
VRVVLTIAGSDPVAGAGIQADLKTFAALGVYGVSAVTAITIQNTSGVREVVPVPAVAARSQIEALVEDLDVAAVKTGMLADADTVRMAADAIRGSKLPNVVIDPVMTATAGGILLADAAVSILTSTLLPLADVVTPNVPEAERLAGISITSPAAAREAARRIQEHGPRAVVITGGHAELPDAVDLLLHDGVFLEFAAARANVGDVHGTGCAFASAVAARLALGDDIPGAVDRAKRYVSGAIAHALVVGKGARVLNHFWEFSI